MFGAYQNCPICNNLHDDGAFIPFYRKTYFICFDCVENLSDKEIKDKLRIYKRKYKLNH